MKEQPIVTAITPTTSQHLQFNSAVLLWRFQFGVDWKPEDVIGATRGGLTFRAVPQYHNVEADGVPTNYKGLQRLDEWDVGAECTMLEFKPDTIELGLGAGVKKTSESGYTKFTVTHNIDEENDYKDIWIVGSLSNGGKAVVQIKNGLNKSGLTLSTADKGEGTFSLNITGHYDYEGLKDGVAPFAIYYPTED